MTRDVKILEDAYQKINEGQIASDDDEINDSCFMIWQIIKFH